MCTRVAVTDDDTSVPPFGGLVRLTVVSTVQRVDVAVPAVVPVVELLPELARRVGLLDRTTACHGCHAVTRDGRVLQPDADLAAQGVQHGDVVAILTGAGDDPGWGHDDVAEAVALSVERRPAWAQSHACWTGLGAAVLLLLVGAPALLTAGANALAAVFGAAVDVALLAAAAPLSRSRGGTAAAVTVAHVGCLYATVAGLCSAHPGLPAGTAFAHAGAALLATGVTAALMMASGRMLMLPAVLVGATALSTGVVSCWTPLDPAPVLTCLLALVVLTTAPLPGMAIRMTATGRHAVLVTDEWPGSAAPAVDLDQVSADVTSAREIMVGLSATIGAVLVLAAPAAVSLGAPGAAIPILGGLVVMLRTRRSRVALDVAIGMTSGVLGVVSTCTSLLWLHHQWRLETGMAAASVGVAVLATRWLRVGDVTRGRLCDLVECVALGAVLPALLLSVGLSLERP